MDAFLSYGQQATSQRPARFIGAVRTRAEMRLAYAAAVNLLHACNTIEDVANWEAERASLIAQIHAEHELYWSGDGFDFLGLRREIEEARTRVGASDVR